MTANDQETEVTDKSFFLSYQPTFRWQLKSLLQEKPNIWPTPEIFMVILYFDMKSDQTFPVLH